MNSINTIVIIVLAIIAVAVLSAVLLGIEGPVIELITQSSDVQAEVSQCLDQNPDYSYQECLEQVENQV